jgi:hypothetical protein
VGHRYGRMVPGSSARVAGEPAAGGASASFLARCLSNQFDLPGKRYAAREDQSGAGPLFIGGVIRQLDGGVGQLVKLRTDMVFGAPIGRIQQRCELRKSGRRQKFHLIRNGG